MSSKMKMVLMVTMQIFIFAFGSDTGHYKDELESVNLTSNHLQSKEEERRR